VLFVREYNKKAQITQKGTRNSGVCFDSPVRTKSKLTQ